MKAERKQAIIEELAGEGLPLGRCGRCGSSFPLPVGRRVAMVKDVIIRKI
jgi:hypothetical protein